jgi:hypothetical protein
MQTSDGQQDDGQDAARRAAQSAEPPRLVGRTDAMHRLIGATNQLMRVELAVLRGGDVDEATFERLVDEFCAAVRAAQLRRSPRPQPPLVGRGAVVVPPTARQLSADEVPEEPLEPLAPTPRLLFARWLAARGRLSG